MKGELFWPKKMASCFDFRVRTSSFDLHQIAQRHKLAKISRIFRSTSENSVKSAAQSPKNSPKNSPKGSPSAPVGRRRFLRVVKNAESAGEEYDNPHLIRRYTKEYVQEQWSQRMSASMDDSMLPYEVTGHTILKKKASQDSPTHSGDQSPSQSKHTSFKEEVQIIEFDKKGKIELCRCVRHVERLAPSDDESSGDVCDFCQRRGREDCPHLSSDNDSDCERHATVTRLTEQTTRLSEEAHADGSRDIKQNTQLRRCLHVSSQDTDSDTEFVEDKFVGIHIDKPSSRRSSTSEEAPDTKW